MPMVGTLTVAQEDKRSGVGGSTDDWSSHEMMTQNLS